MTTRQRLLTALRCEQPDRVPVSLFMNPYQSGSPWAADPSYADLLQACREYEDVFYSAGMPPGFLLTAHPVETQTSQLQNGDTEHRVQTPRGPLTAIYRTGARGQLKRWITEPADVERWLAIPYVPPTVDHAPLREARERLGDRVATQVVLTDPACCTEWIAEETVALWTIEERGLLRGFYDECFRRHRDIVLQVIEGPADAVYFNGPEYCLPPLMSPRDFEEFVCHYDQQLFALIRERTDKLIIVHSHGKVRQFLKQFRDTGLHGLNVLEPPPMGDVVLSEAKQLIGDTVCLIGNLQWSELMDATPEQVRDMVRNAMDQGKPGGGFILSPTAMPYAFPLAPEHSRNLILYLRYGREYGGY